MFCESNNLLERNLHCAAKLAISLETAITCPRFFCHFLILFSHICLASREVLFCEKYLHELLCDRKLASWRLESVSFQETDSGTLLQNSLKR